MKEQVVLFFAKAKGQWVAGTLFFQKGNTLYGRYWGCQGFYENLHFELCYYQGIEYALKNSLKIFEAGAQGEHKISRGFLPCLTYSAHYIRDLNFREGIRKYIQEERNSIVRGIQAFQKNSPMK